jgi:acetyl esterase/lipase
LPAGKFGFDEIRAMRERVVQLRTELGPLPPGRVEVTDLDTAPVPVRRYRPHGDTALLPAVIWIHGGGFVIGSVEFDDFACAEYAEGCNCAIFSVDYRLAPEHPYPAAVDDCFAVACWIAESGEEIGADAARIAIAGASAGANLAAATTLMARDRGGPPLCFQLLYSPALDDRLSTPSAREFAGPPLWEREQIESAWEAYLGDRVGTDDVPAAAAPARATDFSNLPPALIQVGELEVLRDECIDYAQRLLESGVSTDLHVYPGLFHGAAEYAPTALVAQRMRSDRLAALRRALHEPLRTEGPR